MIARLRPFAPVALTLLLLGLAACPDSRPRVVIEFGVAPDTFEGLSVDIDGRIVGKLEKVGAQTRTAFPLTKGPHEVTVLAPGFHCEPAKITLERNAQKIMLILNFGEGTDGKPTIVFQ